MNHDNWFCFIQDIVTDVDVFESGDIHIDGVPNARIHEGMLNAAQCIKQKLLGYCNRTHGRIEIECVPDKPVLDMAWDKLKEMPGVDPEVNKNYHHGLGGFRFPE